jgi:NAD-dependent DNA ligase
MEKQLRDASHAYFVTGKPIMSDAEYDALKDSFCSANPNNPMCSEIGATPASTSKIRLPCYMGSLDKIKTNEATLASWVSKYGGPYVVSDKLDGVSALAQYDANGDLIRLMSRGDGTVGEDITFLAQYISGIPAHVTAPTHASLLVRGELIMQRSNRFESNYRSVLIGAVNARKNIREDVLSYVDFVAYEIIGDVQQSVQLLALNEMGFMVVRHHWVQKLSTVYQLANMLVKKKADSDYDIDGLVVCSDRRHPHTEGSNPPHAFAFKSIIISDTADVVVTSVEWKVSKDGYMIPTVCFEPATLNDVVIKRASGFNARFVADNMLGPGAVIQVVRSGDVIPHITKVLKGASAAALPDDASTYTWTDSNIDIVVSDKSNNPRLISYFFEKLGTKGVSSKTYENLYEHGFKRVRDYVGIRPESFAGLPGFGATKAANVAASINAAFAEATELKLMIASNVFGRGLGEKKLTQLYEKRPRTVEDVMAVGGFGVKTAEQFIAGLKEFCEFVQANGLQFAAHDRSRGRSDTTPDIHSVRP